MTTLRRMHPDEPLVRNVPQCSPCRSRYRILRRQGEEVMRMASKKKGGKGC